MPLGNRSLTIDRQWTPRNRTNSHLRLSPEDAQPFNGPLSATTRVSQYQKGKTNLDFAEARDSEWQWHQLGRMQVCTSLQTDNHASTPPPNHMTYSIYQLLDHITLSAWMLLVGWQEGHPACKKAKWSGAERKVKPN